MVAELGGRARRTKPSQVGVIVDSGGVLLRPIGGTWFPPPCFYTVLAKHGVAFDRRSLEAALGRGATYLDVEHATPLADEAAERPVWLGYYRVILASLGVGEAVDELVEAIVSAWEANVPVEPYPWTRPVLSELHRRQIPVVVLSDAWPSLRRWFRALDLEPYVQGMVISGEEGFTKPDPRSFAKARRLLGDQATEVVFVDDWAGHVEAANTLGLRGVLLRDANDAPVPGLASIADLRDTLQEL
jgi:HAD superfamily hydrolase (TIGR01509 family)